MALAPVDAGAEQVRLLDADPDLAARIPDDDMTLARRHAVAVLEAVPAGPWTPGSIPEVRPFGGVILDGMLAREVLAGDSASVELLADGDVLLPYEVDEPTFVVAETNWTALEPVRVAWLGPRFVPVAARWPQVTAALLERAERRMTRLALTQAIGQLVRVDDRVLALLWQLSERWGKVTPDGVVLPLRLTHRVLARLIGARRPSVTTALTSLERRRLVVRREAGGWLLPGDPPEHLEASPRAASTWRNGRTGGSSLTRVPDGAVRIVPLTRPAALREHVAGLSRVYAVQAARASEAMRHSREAREHSRRLLTQRAHDRADHAPQA